MAPFTLAACGQTSDPDDERSEDEDPDLLNAILEQQLAVAALAREAGAGPLAAETSALAKQRKSSVAELEAFIAEREGKATTEPAAPAEAESATEALALQLEDSIAASLAAIGELSSPAYRQAAHRFVTEDAAALAALRSATGGDVAPDAFVLGTSTEDPA